MIIFLITSVASQGQTVTENFNHNSQATSESNCWEYVNTSIVRYPSNKSINNGGGRPMAEADISASFGASAELHSPFIYFDGTGTISFNHRMSQDDWYYVSEYLQMYLLDPKGNVSGPYFSHVYRQLSFFNPTPNGDPTLTYSESVPVTWTGYYRVMWYWSSYYAFGTGQLDDISISGTFTADDTEEINGYCPCIMNVTDTVCGGEQNDSRTALYPRGSRTYNWNFVGGSGGSIDATVSSNDQTIEVDWIAPSGSLANYTLFAKESTSGSGQPGNETYFDIYVRKRPSYSVAMDTVCPDESVTLTFTGTGTAPFSVSYDTGGSTTTIGVSGTSTTINIPAGASYINFSSVTDANGCLVNPSSLGNKTIYYLSGATAGPIYH